MDYPKMVSCRMTSDDLDRLTASAQLAGMARSEYLRTLIRIPASASGKGAVYVIDNRTMAKMLAVRSRGEARRSRAGPPGDRVRADGHSRLHKRKR